MRAASRSSRPTQRRCRSRTRASTRAVSMFTHTDVDDFAAVVARGRAGAATGRAARLPRSRIRASSGRTAFVHGRDVPELHPGYRDTAGTDGGARASGTRASGRRSGATHLPLGLFLHAFLDAGLPARARSRSPRDRDYPYVVALRCAPMSVAVLALGRSAPGRGARLPRRGSRAGRDRSRRCPRRCTRACARRSRRRASTRSTRTRREAWDAAARGEHFVVTTGTASGKTLAFNLPVLDALAREPKQRALYLYPTKALAQDQLRALGSFRLPKLRAAIYDGDTADRAPLAGPQVGEPDPLQPGHAPRRRAAAPRPLGRRALEPRLRDRRRGARLPRRLRLARRQRAAPAAAARAGLRRRAAVPARLGDDREPGRARRARCSGSRRP